MDKINEKNLIETVVTYNRKPLRFSTAEQEDSGKKKESTLPVKALRFTRRAATGVVKQVFKTTLHHGQTVRLRDKPRDVKKERQRKQSRKVYTEQGAGGTTARGTHHTIDTESTGHGQLHFEGQSQLIFTTDGQSADGSPSGTNANYRYNYGEASHLKPKSNAGHPLDSLPSGASATPNTSHTGVAENMGHGQLLFEGQSQLVFTADGQPTDGSPSGTSANHRYNYDEASHSKPKSNAGQPVDSPPSGASATPNTSHTGTAEIMGHGQLHFEGQSRLIFTADGQPMHGSPSGTSANQRYNHGEASHSKVMSTARQPVDSPPSGASATPNTLHTGVAENMGHGQLHFEGQSQLVFTADGQPTDGSPSGTSANHRFNYGEANHAKPKSNARQPVDSPPSGVSATPNTLHTGAAENMGHGQLHIDGGKSPKGHSKLMFTAAEQATNGSPFGDVRVATDKKERLGHSKLKFTEAEKAAGVSLLGEPVSKEWQSGVNSNKKIKKERYSKAKTERRGFVKEKANALMQDISDEISKQADASENDAVRAADRERKVVGKGLHYGGRVGKWHRSGRDRRIEKRENKKIAKELKLEHKSKQHFELYGDELPSKFRRDSKQQKRRMKRKQIRTFLDTKLGEKRVDITLKAVRFILGAVKKVVVSVVSYIGFPLLGVVVIVALLLGMAALMFSLMQTTAITMLSAYTSADAAIEAASILATRLEAELELAINGMPSQWEWGHIDEFRYDVDPIGHNPFELMAYLSVTHPGFDMGEQSPVPGVIEQLHNARYDLILEEQVETRYYTETYTDPVTGEVTEDEVPYDYYILNVILRSRGIEVTVTQQLKATPKSELWEWYGVLMETCGARQEFDNPFAEDWRGNVTSLYGYRLNPLGKNLQTHRGLDIAMPEGTPIAAGLSGRVQYVGNDTVYGKYIVIESEDGTTMKYAHCHTIQLVTGDSVTAGDNIATVGNTGTSTGSHVHIEIKREGQYLNPIYALEFGGNEE